MERCCCPQPYSVGIYSIAGKPNLIPEAGCGQSPRKKQSGCFIFGAKNLTFLYRTIEIGNTINRKINRHQIQFNNSTEYGTYLNLIRRIFPP